MRVAILGVALVVCGLLIGSQVSTTTPPAEASFHDMRIYGVMGGKGDTSSAQFVELRMASGGQNQMQFAHLCIYDADGFPWARFVFPTSVPVSTNQSSILVASGAMNAEWQAGGAVADFIFGPSNTTALNVLADVNAPLSVPNGAIVYDGDSDTGCSAPTPIDSIAYGTGYNGVAFFGDPIDQDLPISGSQGFQLTTTPVDFPPTDNSAEYALTNCIIARNNAGASGPVGGECAPTSTPTNAPTATPTDAPTATPTDAPTATIIDETFPPTTPAATTPTTSVSPFQGDADCDGDVDEDDGIDVLEHVAGLEDAACPEQAEVTCDEIDAIDALRIFQYLADLAAFCSEQ